MTKYVPKKRVDIVSLAVVRESTTLYEGRKCTSPMAAYDLLAPFIENKDREHLVVVGLNTKKEPNMIHIAHIGGLKEAMAIPRDILKPILLSNSESVLIAHNHPSGDVSPSNADIQATKKLQDACDVLSLNFVDHIIIGSTGDYLSLREKGLMD